MSEVGQMLSKTKADKAIKKVFPNSKVIGIKKLKKGMINENYAVKLKNPNKNLILRIYPNDEWKAKKEAHIYDLISRKTNVPVPAVYAVDVSKRVLPKAYSLLSKIDGNELNLVYKKTKNKELARQAGAILAKIHTIKFPYFGWIMGNNIKPKFNKWQDFIFYDLNEKIKKLSRIRKVPKKIITDSLEYIDDKKHLLNINSGPCLLHKDYHFSHILANKENITGIVDVEWAIAGHNEFDLIKSECWMFESLPEIKKPFFDGYRRYGAISKKFNQRKELYELILSLGLVSLSYEKKSKRWFDCNLNRTKMLLGLK